MKPTIDFFLEMEIPMATHQKKKMCVVNGRPRLFNSPELKAAREKYLWMLAPHKPDEPLEGAICLETCWQYAPKGKKKRTGYKTTKPDTDNLVKLLKDCMTEQGFWRDDCQVAREVVEKRWADTEGIHIALRRII